MEKYQPAITTPRLPDWNWAICLTARSGRQAAQKADPNYRNCVRQRSPQTLSFTINMLVRPLPSQATMPL